MNKHWLLLKSRRDSLYKEFLASKGNVRTSLLFEIMELDEELDALEKDQERPAVSQAGSRRPISDFYGH